VQPQELSRGWRGCGSGWQEQSPQYHVRCTCSKSTPNLLNWLGNMISASADLFILITEKNANATPRWMTLTVTVPTEWQVGKRVKECVTRPLLQGIMTPHLSKTTPIGSIFRDVLATWNACLQECFICLQACFICFCAVEDSQISMNSGWKRQEKWQLFDLLPPQPKFCDFYTKENFQYQPANLFRGTLLTHFALIIQHRIAYG